MVILKAKFSSMSTFLIRSATSHSSSYPVGFTRLDGPRSRPNPHLSIQEDMQINYNKFETSGIIGFQRKQELGKQLAGSMDVSREIHSKILFTSMRIKSVEHSLYLLRPSI